MVARRLVQGYQRPGQLRIRQPHHQPTADSGLCGVIQYPPQHLDQHHFKQPIRQKARPATYVVGLGKQQIQGGPQPFDGVQRHPQHRRQRLHKRIALAAIEIQRRAGEVRPGDGRIDELMVHGAGIEQQRRFGQRHALRAGRARQVPDFHFALAQHMQKAPARLRFEGLDTAERPRVEQAGAHAEAIQQGRQTINRGKHRGIHGLDYRTCFMDITTPYIQEWYVRFP
ncbi:hypothetical protein G6F57_017964 [Rhizopus arrhizus]|nr:hypothetical protein G6F57_017964 [Rhizopus arrhizus]